MLGHNYQCPNPYYESYSAFIQSPEQEAEFRKGKIPYWFGAFYRNTDEKQIIEDTFTSILSKLVYMGYFNKFSSILDIGCCESDLPVRVINIFNKLFPDNFFYFGIDRNSTAIVKTQSHVSNISPKVKHDYYGANYLEMSFGEYRYMFHHSYELRKYGVKTFDLIICSHVAYYAKDMTLFVSSALAARSQNGFAMFLHEADDSIPSQLRKKCGFFANHHTSNFHTSSEVRKALGDLGMKYYHTTLVSKIAFSDNLSLSSNILLTRDTSSLTKEQIEQKQLLEFIFQVPLETLFNRGMFEGCIGELVEHLRINDNYVLVESHLELVVPNDFDFNQFASLGD